METFATQEEWRGAARWLSLAVAGIYLLQAAPLLLGRLDAGSVVSLMIGLIVGAATFTGNPKLPLGLTCLAALQIAGFVWAVFAGIAPTQMLVRLPFIGIIVAAAIVLRKAHLLRT